MAPIIKICSPFVPGVGQHAAAAVSSEQAATDERVDNIRIAPVPIAGVLTTRGLMVPGGPIKTRAAVERLKLWENGRRLRVKFLDGIPEVQARVAAVAREWEAVANITFDFVSG